MVELDIFAITKAIKKKKDRLIVFFFLHAFCDFNSLFFGDKAGLLTYFYARSSSEKPKQKKPKAAATAASCKQGLLLRG